ncbi:MAG: tRNA (adenosine(37)-N6)-dimethylallyltransferase MiaA [Solobacterium sp.]|nr:tRNA (adenosine(37)-N6)-dimethylallyltransferase MiaA [Solobacterium sp.]
MKKVLVIAGPTASGKSDFAVEVALRFGGEIISGDSIQIYRGMDIGSGKIRTEEMKGVPHHLIDIKEANEPYSVSEFQKLARSCIEKISFPIICGGTGLYLKACLYDYVFEDEPRQETPAEYEAMDNESLHHLLEQIDMESAQRIHPNNRQRVIRAIQIAERSGKTKSEIEAAQNHTPIYDIFIAGCTAERSVLYERINARVEQMFRDGLEQEIQGLLQQGIQFTDPGMKGIGYREFESYWNGTASIEEVKAEIQKHSRNYAKRQYTWLNHQMEVHWFEPTDPASRNRMMDAIMKWKEQ